MHIEEVGPDPAPIAVRHEGVVSEQRATVACIASAAAIFPVIDAVRGILEYDSSAESAAVS